METKYFISIFLLVIGLPSMGQSTVQTPWGSTVNVWTQGDMTTSQRNDMDDSLAADFPNAVFHETLPADDPNDPTPSSSSKLKCHGYAWYMSWRGENKFDAPWNMHKEDAETYFNDPSYLECSEAEADILWIDDGAHSALTTDDPDDLLSKWATGPLATHGKGSTDSPWPTTSTNTTYYKRCCTK